MAIGNWGTTLVFETSDSRILTPANLARSVSADWATHSRIGLKDQTEFLRPALQKITFDLTLDAMYGVRPRTMLDLIAACVENGTVQKLVIGGKQVGKNYWRITSTSETWQVMFNKGELVRAKVTVTMEEYL